MVLRGYMKIVSEHIVCDFARVQKRHFEKFEVALIRTNMVAVKMSSTVHSAAWVREE